MRWLQLLGYGMSVAAWSGSGSAALARQRPLDQVSGAAIEALDHAAGLRMPALAQAMLGAHDERATSDAWRSVAVLISLVSLVSLISLVKLVRATR